VRIDASGTQGVSTGSGFFYASGLVLTNAHVVEGVETAQVSLIRTEGARPDVYSAIVRGRDEANDLAVLQVDGAESESLPMGSVSDAAVGDTILAIGFPLGIEGDMSVTRGIVSRKLDSTGLTLIQHDAKILPGNSGGPLLTLDGLVIGINTAVVSDISGMTGETLNFAIAAEEASERLAFLERGSPGPAEARQYVSARYGHSFDVPAGWYVLEESDESVYTYSDQTGAFASVNVDPDTSLFASGQLWSDFHFYAGVLWVDPDSYELLHDEVTERPDGAMEWRYTERFARVGDDFTSLGTEVFTYRDGLGLRIYIEAPESVFDSTYAELQGVLTSLKEPTVRPPGTPASLPRECVQLAGTEFSGSIHNATVAAGSDIWLWFDQYGCDIVGMFGILEADLYGSGPLVGGIDGRAIEFVVPGTTNDAGFDLFFSGYLSSESIDGDYSVPDVVQKGTWSVTPDSGATVYTIAPTPTPRPGPTPTRVPTSTPTPRLAPTATPTPRPTATPTRTPTPTPIPRPAGGWQDSGPLSGDLVHDPDANTVKLRSAGVDLHDFIAEVTFSNPYAGGSSDQTWDYGFLFHNHPSDTFDIVVVQSNGYWFQNRRGPATEDGDDEEIGSGRLSGLRVGAGERNELKLVVAGTTGSLILNSTAVAVLQVEGEARTGDVRVASGYFDGDEKEGAKTGFVDFRVRSLDLQYPSPRLDHQTSGILDAETGSIETKLAGFSADFVVDASFENPYSTSVGSWSYGFMILGAGSEFEAVFIRSDGRWYHVRREDSPESDVTLKREYFGSISTSDRGTNALRALVVGDRGWLLVNGAVAGSFDLIAPDEGLIVRCDIMSGYFADDHRQDTFVRYSELSMWGSTRR